MSTLFLLIFASIKFRDFRDFKKFTKSGARKEKIARKLGPVDMEVGDPR